MADNTTTTSTAQQQAERQARIERVRQDLERLIEQIMRDVQALEACIAERKQAQQQLSQQLNASADGDAQ